MLKTCTACGEEKDLSEFHRLAGSPDGLQRRCKPCRRAEANASAARCRPERRARARARRTANSERHILWGIRQRCENPKNPNYHRYGGRGITLCDRWKGPEGLRNFIAEVGRRPSPEYSVDRIDNNRGYEPGNVRWARKEQQNRNTRQNVHLTIDGVTKTRAEWAREAGVTEQLIRDRMEKLGWSATKAVRTPPRPCARRARR